MNVSVSQSTNNFIDVTRKNFHPVTKFSHSPGNQFYYNLASVGFLADLRYIFNGTLTAKHATKTSFSFAQQAPFNLAETMKLTLNNGVDVFSTTGYGLHCQNILLRPFYHMDKVLGDSNVYRTGNLCSAAGTANHIQFSLEQNVSINDKDLLGFIKLDNNNVTANICVQMAHPTVLLAAVDSDVELTLTGQWEVSIEFFKIPQDPKDYPYLGVIHQVLEEKRTIVSTGKNYFEIPKGGEYVRIINNVMINGDFTSDAVESMSLIYNLNNEPGDIPEKMNMTKDMQLILQRQNYGRDLPKGMFVWDFNCQTLPNMANQRDYIQSAELLEFNQSFTIDSATTLGSHNNILNTIRELYIPFEY